MNCFKHREAVSIGLCKACQKAVCDTCAIDTGSGLSCCESCTIIINEMHQIFEKNKAVYGISIGKKGISTVSITYGLFALLFFIYGIYSTRKYGELDILSLLMFLGAFAISIATYIRDKKLNINL